MTFIQGSSLENTGTDTELYPQGRDAFSWPSHGAYDENRQLLGTEEESSEVIADSRIMFHVGSWLAWWPHAFIRLEEVVMRKMKTRMCGWSQRSSTAITSHSLEPCRQIQEESYLAHRWPFSLGNFFHWYFQAKEFFEKSRLPIQELRQIWQLSDVTKVPSLVLCLICKVNW